MKVIVSDVQCPGFTVPTKAVSDVDVVWGKEETRG